MHPDHTVIGRGWVCLDIGECLIDESRTWSTWAQVLEVPPFTLAAIVGAAIIRGEPLAKALPGAIDRDDWAGIRDAFENAYGGLRAEDLYPDVLPTLARLRAGGFNIAVISNQPAIRRAQLLALGMDVDVVATSGTLGAAKPDPAFFAHALDLLGAPSRTGSSTSGTESIIDVIPSLAAGIHAVWLRRGPWGLLQQLPSDATMVRQIQSLTELPDLLADLTADVGQRAQRLP
jgi:FMN hydrolase / 5-amino-6-(5-phospho-D-ribitylamino)uracil phosphatase